MNEKPQNQEKEQVQKLQKYDVCEYLLEVDKETQITYLKLLVNDLKLTNMKEAMVPLGVKSHNGVKNHKETLKIGKTIFAVLKGNVVSCED